MFCVFLDNCLKRMLTDSNSLWFMMILCSISSLYEQQFFVEDVHTSTTIKPVLRLLFSHCISIKTCRYVRSCHRPLCVVNKGNKNSNCHIFFNKVELPRTPSGQPSGSSEVPQTRPLTSVVSARMRLQPNSRSVQLMTVSMPGNIFFVFVSIIIHMLNNNCNNFEKCFILPRIHRDRNYRVARVGLTK